jgi:Holliday junction resolvase RusA-like endonuclease
MPTYPFPKLPGEPTAQILLSLEPIPASRPRFSVNANNKFSKKFTGVTTHLAPRYEKYMHQLALRLITCPRPADADKICAIVCEFIVAVPSQILGYRLKKAERQALEGDYCFEDNIGDVDNLLKPIADAMEKKGWLLNDSQLGGKFAIKRYARHAEGEQIGTVLTILTRRTSFLDRYKLAS